jgi:H3 lysine-79-specific histone-lysine N-methyltransferase
MGPFDHIQKKGSVAIKPQPAQIRKEIISTVSPVWKTPDLTLRKVVNGGGKAKTSQPTSSNSKTRSTDTRKRPSKLQQRLESDSDDDDNDNEYHVDRDSRKRQRVDDDIEPDVGRKMRNKKSFLRDSDGIPALVHAAGIAAVDSSTKYRPAFPNLPSIQVEVQYPSSLAAERYSFTTSELLGEDVDSSRYELVVPMQKDDFKPLEDITEVLDVITSYYLPKATAERMRDDSHGLLRRLKRSIDRFAGGEFVRLIGEWNNTLSKLREDGTISKALDQMKCLDLKLVERILTQTYSRTVSLHVRELAQYENGTDNIYGELLPKFISTILKKDTQLKSNQIFVDLGSGVGNVVLQAALEIGCESWGCEVMEKACNLAELQLKEFRARCQLWGLAAGEVHLEKGDFLKNSVICKILRKADVVLVNNQAFTPELNENLISLFLDLKEGCRIVSLKSFVPNGHKITSRNLGSAHNVLDVVEKQYFSACVSWTDAPGKYYISTKDGSRLRSFVEKLKSSGTY